MASVIGSGKKYVPYIKGSVEVDEDLFSIGTPTMPIGGRWRFDDLFRDPEDLFRDPEALFSDFNADEYMAEMEGLLETLKEEGVYGAAGCLLYLGAMGLGGLAFLIWWAHYESEKAKKKIPKKKDDDDGGEEGTIVFEPPALFAGKLLNIFENLIR